MPRIGLFPILAAALLAACSQAPEKGKLARRNADRAMDQMHRGARELFQIDLPAGCVINSRGAKLDFEVFDISCGGVAYGGVYAGNFPDESVPRSRTIETGMAWPAKIQAWSNEVAGHQTEADRMVASLRLSRKG